jgi:hypothetical protein
LQNIEKLANMKTLCLGISNHQKWFEITQLGIISHVTNELVHTWTSSIYKTNELS